jgi:threonine dehydrogenase-like Zn-dependent dehydrogenase
MSENTMTAVVEYGPANLRLEPVPIPVASAKDLVIEIEACGVCTAVSADWSIIGDSKELTIYRSHLGPFCYPKEIQGMLDGWIPTEGVVTATLPLAEFEHGLKLMETGENGSIKAVLKP